MTKTQLKINRPIQSMTKRISSHALKTGDRFMHKEHTTLCFKLNVESQNKHYLCSNEGGHTFWLSGEENVERLNGVASNLSYLSKQYIKEFNRQEKLRKQGVQPTF